MRIPKQIKIVGHIVNIDCSQELEGFNGQSNISENKIQISKNITQSQKEATVIHEIFHFLNTTFGADRFGRASQDSLSEQFYQVLADNKMLK